MRAMNRTLTATTPPYPRALPGSYVRGRETYASLAEFVLADPRRALSHERDVGLGWERDGCLHRAAVVLATRELYLCQLGPPEQGGGHVRVLATLPRARAVDDLLGGWRDAHGEPDSLDWLLERVAARAPAPALAGASSRGSPG